MKKFGKNFGIYIIIFALVLGTAYFYKGMDSSSSTKEIKFSTFSSHLSDGDYKKLNITDRKLTGTKANGDKEVAYAPSVVEISWMEDTYVYPMLKDGKIAMDSDKPQSDFNLLSMLPTIIMIVALIFLFYFMMSQGGNIKAFQFGKNRARLYKDNGKSTTFKDVAGLDEEKEELQEIVDFLINPDNYTKRGARIPK